jgi:hypothetical protein
MQKKEILCLIILGCWHPFELIIVSKESIHNNVSDTLSSIAQKNSDARRISFQNVLYEGHSVIRVNKLQYYAATRISSASECFAGICGYWQHNMTPAAYVLGIHLPGQKVVLTSDPGDVLEKIDIPSPLERYFGRLTDSSYDQLACIDYHSRYSVDARPIQERILQFTSCVQFTDGCMNFFCPKTASSTASCQKLGGPPISQW